MKNIWPAWGKGELSRLSFHACVFMILDREQEEQFAACHRGPCTLTEGLGGSVRSLVLAWVTRRSQAHGCEDKKDVCGSRGRSLGGAKPSGARSLRHVPTSSAPRVLEHSASRDWWPSGLHAKHCRMWYELRSVSSVARYYSGPRDPEVKCVSGKG